MKNNYEKLGVFYLGKEYDLASRTLKEDLILYDSKDLNTHAVIIGMTGSGKTGLGIGILEEALIDNIPIIAIDPKGDLPNLLLNFPDLNPKDFLPWVNNSQQSRLKPGAKVYPPGVKHRIGLPASRLQPTLPFTRREAMQGCRLAF